MISALTFSSLSMKPSRVGMITPSVEFSTGTTPRSAPPRSTSSNTAPIVLRGMARAESPNWCFTAMCENVPSGPRYATFTVRSRERQALNTSWNTERMASVGNGPGLEADSRSMICRSREGT